MVTHVEPKKILIKIDFAEPLKVSQGEMSHVFYIQAQLGQFSTKSGKKLPDSIVKRRELRRMFASEAEAAAIEDAS